MDEKAPSTFQSTPPPLPPPLPPPVLPYTCQQPPPADRDPFHVQAAKFSLYILLAARRNPAGRNSTLPPPRRRHDRFLFQVEQESVVAGRRFKRFATGIAPPWS